MVAIDDRLIELGLQLPEPFAPPPDMAFSFEPVCVSNGYAHVAAHGPMDGAEILVVGAVGEDLTLEQGYEAGRLTALSMLASLRAELDDLSSIVRWLRAVGYVRCAPGFEATTLVFNGFGDLVHELWGEAGRPARSVPGVTSLPFGVPIAVEALVELRD